ncbi:hypothetical protein QBC42DRAFT_264548, partial [Cladorrhinum samala]
FYQRQCNGLGFCFIYLLTYLLQFFFFRPPYPCFIPGTYMVWLMIILAHANVYLPWFLN